MTAENLKNWLKEKLGLGDNQIAVGSIDGNKDQYIGVYDGKSTGSQRICIGGKKNHKVSRSNLFPAGALDDFTGHGLREGDGGL